MASKSSFTATRPSTSLYGATCNPGVSAGTKNNDKSSSEPSMDFVEMIYPSTPTPLGTSDFDPVRLNPSSLGVAVTSTHSGLSRARCSVWARARRFSPETS